MKIMKIGVVAILLASASWSCAGDEAATKEPVDAKTPAIPDAPGDAGETAAKPAGEAAPSNAAKDQEKLDAAAKAAAAKRGNYSANADAKVSGDMYVTSGTLNVHSSASMKGKTVRTLKKGDKVTVSSCDGAWCTIGPKEFVSKKFLSADAPKAHESKKPMGHGKKAAPHGKKHAGKKPAADKPEASATPATPAAEPAAASPEAAPVK